MSKADLKLDWCSHEAAKYAVTHWHYSRTMPVSRVVHIGVWESGVFVGCVLFSRGASPWIGSPYGLKQTEACELVRVALREHQSETSRAVSIALRLLKKQSPGLRLIVSYADPEQGHHGGIYQAMNWLYVGTSAAKWTANGQHNRTLGTSIEKAKKKYGENVKIEMHAPKHKYLMPLDTEMRAQILPLAKPYPKRAGSADSGTSDFQSERGGATPTPALTK